MSRKLTFAVHLSYWKHAVFERYFPERAFVYLPIHLDERTFRREWASRILQEPDADIFVWSRKAPEALLDLAREHARAITYIEDGFIRSAVPNASRTPPISLTFDGQTPYFDAHHPSDLETMLATYDFQADTALMARAANGISRMVASGLSKYNSRNDVDLESLIGPGTRPRVLVVGQVEDDASIKWGCQSPVTNNDVVRLAARENPEAEIVYKPHPDILSRVRLATSDPADVAELCTIIRSGITLSKCLEGVDRVYTITSLAGFEALMRGLPVTACGCPFYAGWGLTDDRQAMPRRGRKLSIEALFAAAYLLYPAYFDPETGRRITFEEALDLLQQALAESRWNDETIAQPDETRAERLWRRLKRPRVLLLSPIVGRIGNRLDVMHFEQDPAGFFQELENPRFRFAGRLMFPFASIRPRQRK